MGVSTTRTATETVNSEAPPALADYAFASEKNAPAIGADQ